MKYTDNYKVIIFIYYVDNPLLDRACIAHVGKYESTSLVCILYLTLPTC